MDTTLIAGTTLLTAGAAIVLQATYGGRTHRRAVVRSLDAIGGRTPTEGSQLSYRERLAPSVERFSAAGGRMSSAGSTSKLAAQLDLAGNPAPWSLERLLAVKALLALAGTAFGMLVGSNGTSARMVLLGATAGAVAFYLPNVLVYNAGTKRQVRIQQTLPDALDLLTVSVEAGMGFDAAMGNVAKNTKGPLAGEFFRVLQEMQMKSRSDAFRALATRTTVVELRTFVSSLVQADALGIPIAAVLREQSNEMRVKRRQRAEEKAMKVPVKILFPMMMFILPVLFIIVLAPAFMGMASSW